MRYAQARLSTKPSVQKPGRNGTAMPSEPDVKPRHRLPAMRNTCENAMVARPK
jgi:hypothetical protein